MKKYIVLLAMLLCIFFTACGASALDQGEVRKYADPMTESILTAMNSDDYDQFSKDFDQPMKVALSKSAYDATIPTIKGKIGNYTGTIEFINIETKDNYIIVIYKAGFSQEPDGAIIRSVFSDINGKKYISGFWIDSPKLHTP